MERVVALASVLALLLAAPPARADDPAVPDPDDSGFSLVGRAAWARPLGDLDRSDRAVDDLVSAAFPLSIEILYRFQPWLQVGPFLDLAPAAVVNSACAAGDRCSANAIRFGVGAQLHARAGKRVDPWAGLAIGMEVLEATTRSATGKREERWAGFEAPILSAGVDLGPGRWLAIGPFASASFGEYTSFRDEQEGTATSVRIEGRAPHFWLAAGLRVRVDL